MFCALCSVQNILILGDNYLKVADFGSCRGIYTQAPYTEYISTRWYRAPECLPRGTRILLANGTPIKVEEVKPGMALLGVDNRPVRVAEDGVHAHEEAGVFAIHAQDPVMDYETTAGHRVTLRWCAPPTLSMHAASHGSEAGAFVARLSYFSSKRDHSSYLRKIVLQFPCVLSDPEQASSTATELELDDDDAEEAELVTAPVPIVGSVLLHGSVRSITQQVCSLLQRPQSHCMRVGTLFELSAQELHDRQKELRVGGKRPRVAGRRVPTPAVAAEAAEPLPLPQPALSAEPSCWGYTKRIASQEGRQQYIDDLTDASSPRVVYLLLNPLSPDSKSDEHALRFRGISFRQLEDTQRALGLDCSDTVVMELNPQADAEENQLERDAYDQLCEASVRSAIARGSNALVAFGAHTRAMWLKALSAFEAEANFVHSVKHVTSVDGRVRGLTLIRISDQSQLQVWFAPHPCAWSRLRHTARALTLAHASSSTTVAAALSKFVDPSVVPLRCISWVSRRTSVINIHIAEPLDEHRRYTLANGVATHNCLLTNGYYDFKMDLWGIGQFAGLLFAVEKDSRVCCAAHSFAHSFYPVLCLVSIRAGCVMFEILSLFPLFPGSNELDQIEKIHAILGTPTQEVLLEKFKAHSSHIKNFNFPARVGTGIAKLVPHASAEAVDLMERLLAYDPEQRITARQALRHPYFKELREAEKRERIRTASPKLPLSEGGRASRAHTASGAAAEDDADGKDSGAAAAAADKSASSDSSSLPAPVIPNLNANNSSNKKKQQQAGASSRATGAAAGVAASSSVADAPHKKFPSIMPNSHKPLISQVQPIVAGGGSTTLPPAAGATGGGGGMPPINKGASQQVMVLTSLASTIDSIPSTDASPSHAASAAAPTGKRQSKGSKAAKTVVMLAQQILAQQQSDAAAAAAAADALSETGSLKSEYTDSAGGTGGDGSSPRGADGEDSLRDRMALKRKERAKEREMASLAKAPSAQHQTNSHKKNSNAASPATQGRTLSKTSSQHKLLPPNPLVNAGSGGSGSYQGYSAQAQHLQSLAAVTSGLASNAAGGAAASSGSSKPQRPAKGSGAIVSNALLPSIGAGPTKGAASYDPVVAAAAAAAAASARHQQQQAAHHPPTLAQLRSSSSLAQLAGGGGAASHAPARASGAGSPPSDDYYDEYEDDTIAPSAASSNTAVASSSLDQLQQAAAALAKKKAAAAAAASAANRSTKGARKGPGHSPLVTALQQHASPPSELLSLSGHTAPLSMHSSSSTTQLRAAGGVGYVKGPAKKQQKASAAAQLSLALQSLEVGNAASKKSSYS